MSNFSLFSPSWIQEKNKKHQEGLFFKGSISTSEKRLLAGKLFHDDPENLSDNFELELAREILDYLTNPFNKNRYVYRLLSPSYKEIRAFMAHYDKYLADGQSYSSKSDEINLELINKKRTLDELSAHVNQEKTRNRQEIESIVARITELSREGQSSDTTPVIRNVSSTRATITWFLSPPPLRFSVFQKRKPFNRNLIEMEDLNDALKAYKSEREKIRILKWQDSSSKEVINTLNSNSTANLSEDELLQKIDAYMSNPKNQNRRFYKILINVYCSKLKNLIAKYPINNSTIDETAIFLKDQFSQNHIEKVRYRDLQKQQDELEKTIQAKKNELEKLTQYHHDKQQELQIERLPLEIQNKKQEISKFITQSGWKNTLLNSAWNSFINNPSNKFKFVPNLEHYIDTYIPKSLLKSKDEFFKLLKQHDDLISEYQIEINNRNLAYTKKDKLTLEESNEELDKRSNHTPRFCWV